jgi:stearoyl-CoA desaturase (delta-9 desaturase)
MTKFWERFFFIFTYITQGSHYMSPRAYAIMHRLHHAHTDTELDPHSPNFSPNLFHMMLRTRRIYTEIYKGRMAVDEKYTHNLPGWDSFDKWANSTWSRALWMAGYVLFFITFATSHGCICYCLLSLVWVLFTEQSSTGLHTSMATEISN